MKFIVKFNLILVGTLTAFLVIIGWISQRQLEDTAHTETLISARMMLETATATRNYTTEHVAPLLENQMRYSFLPESVGSFAATEMIEEVRKLFPAFEYREAVLNPTNPRDRANLWEAELVSQLKAEPTQDELVGKHGTGAGERMYLARRIVVSSPACLQCHGSVESAPKTLLARYGSLNGFGWQLNETIGTQMVSMPVQSVIGRSQAKLWPIIATVGASFVALVIALNAVVVLMLLRPLTRLAAAAEQASMGAEGVPEFVFAGNDQIAVLSRAFARMRTSLQKAIAMLDT